MKDWELKKTKSYGLVVNNIGGEERAMIWFKKPNSALGKESPIELMKKGQGEKVYKHLLKILKIKPGK